MQVETSRCPYLRTVLMVLVIAAAYCITGRLGLLLAIPPGYATAIWPPSEYRPGRREGQGKGVGEKEHNASPVHDPETEPCKKPAPWVILMPCDLDVG